jgi:hypothetical protein
MGLPTGSTIKIYRLLDPRNSEVRYIGVTKFTLEHRLNRHIGESLEGVKTHKCRWISKLLRSGLTPIAELIEIVAEDVWSERERFWITYYLL